MSKEKNRKTAIRVKIKTDENTYVHFDTEINCYTLCGLETAGDESLGISEAVPVKAKVNCPDCIRVVNFCHGINKTEFKNKSL